MRHFKGRRKRKRRKRIGGGERGKKRKGEEVASGTKYKTKNLYYI